MNEYCICMFYKPLLLLSFHAVREPVPNQDTVGSGIENTHDRHYRDKRRSVD